MGKFEESRLRSRRAEVRQREKNREAAAAELLDLFEDQEDLAERILVEDLEVKSGDLAKALAVWRKQARKRL